jgi:hypothetical protein
MTTEKRGKLTKVVYAGLIAGIFLLSGLTAFGIWTSATSSNASNAVSSLQPDVKFSTGSCPSQFFLAAAPNGTLVLNVHWTVKNDEDSGFSGYWALDYYTTTLKVWQLTNGNFYVEKIYAGYFQSPQTAISPGSAAQAQNTSVFGTMYGGYNATFSGTFTPGGKPTSGYLGIKDYGGTISDVLKGTYGNGQVGDTHAYSYLSDYFSGVTNFNEPFWGWAYLLNPTLRVHFETMNQWCNYYNIPQGSSGDILYRTF